MIKVVIVDDHPLFRAGAASSFAAERDFEVVGEASSGSAALEMIEKHLPDVVLLDIRLDGDVNGIQLAKWIRAEELDVKVVMLTNYANEPYVRASMETGVDGYLLKDTPASEVIESLRMIIQGRTVFSTRVSEKIVRGYLNSSAKAEIASPDRLTYREVEVLQLLVKGAANSDIASQLHVSPGTVQFHLSSIYSKLGVQGRVEAIVKAAREGLIVIDE